MDKKNQKKLYVTLIGRTNSGKSTLVNHMVNKKITAVSKRPHTTNRVIKGIYTEDNCQIIFLDTPGITYVNGSTPNNEIAKQSIDKTNPDHINIFLFPANKFLEDRLINFSKFIPSEKKIALISKIDIIAKPKLLPLTQKLHEVGFEQILYFSTYDPISKEELKKFLINKAVESEWDFDEKAYTDISLKELIKEATKEILFNKFYEELPYEILIKNENIKQNKKGEYIIHQELFLKKHAHHIILGRIKEISMAVATNIQNYLNTKKKIHLFIEIVELKK